VVAQTPKTPAPTPVVPEASQTPHPAAKASSAGFWPWLSLLLALGWFGTVFAWWWRVRLHSDTTQGPLEDNESLRKLEKQIKEKCLANDSQGSSRALLRWARQNWQNHPPVSLTAMAQRCPSPLAEQLQALDRTLYAPDATSWQGTQLWQQFSKSKPKNRQVASDQSMGLRPLYSD